MQLRNKESTRWIWELSSPTKLQMDLQQVFKHRHFYHKLQHKFEQLYPDWFSFNLTQQKTQSLGNIRIQSSAKIVLISK